MEKLKKILINSSQQCGRSRLMEIEIIKNLDEIIQKYDNIVLIDFYEKKLNCSDNIKKALIGPEGGFSQKEKEILYSFKVLGFDTSMILRSESAAVVISSKVLL